MIVKHFGQAPSLLCPELSMVWIFCIVPPWHHGGTNHIFSLSRVKTMQHMIWISKNHLALLKLQSEWGKTWTNILLSLRDVTGGQNMILTNLWSKQSKINHKPSCLTKVAIWMGKNLEKLLFLPLSQLNACLTGGTQKSLFKLFQY